MPDLLEVKGLDVSYAGVAAVTGVSFVVPAGEIVGLIGPNGAGKSSTLHALMGMVGAERGDVVLEGRSLRGLPPEKIARCGMALVPEGRRIYADFTVEENLRLGLVGRPDRDRGVAVLLVEQRAQRAVALADRTHVLTRGRLRMTLTPNDAADTERLVAAYLA